MSLRFITPLLSKVSHKNGCQMRSDISKRNHTATTVCSSKKVVCHRVAGVPAQRHKARAEGLWIETFAWFCKSLTCLFPLGSLNGEVYILCPAGVSLRASRWPYSQHKAQIFTDVEERAAAQKGVSEFHSTDDGFIWERKFHIWKNIMCQQREIIME